MTTMQICEVEDGEIKCWSGDVTIKDGSIKDINKVEEIGEFEKLVSPVLEGQISEEEDTLIIGPEHPRFD